VDGAVAFGAAMRSAHFLLADDLTFVNHGAFGAPLRPAFEAADRWRLHAETNPLRFIDRCARVGGGWIRVVFP